MDLSEQPCNKSDNFDKVVTSCQEVVPNLLTTCDKQCEYILLTACWQTCYKMWDFYVCRTGSPQQHLPITVGPFTKPTLSTFPVGGNPSTRRKPTTFGRALTFTLFTWGLGLSCIEKVITETWTLEVKRKCANHLVNCDHSRNFALIILKDLHEMFEGTDSCINTTQFSQKFFKT
jgi:hypothetical protein